ncbi:MAG: hypothetical protein GEU80_03675 [Dehalococcoidia bacterium]|nr:hypothetical protein [Dehalococcoidia bacterium]
MRLVTYRQGDAERAGAMLDGDRILDLNRADASLPSTVRGLLEGGPEVLERARRAVEDAEAGAMVALADAELLAPVPDPSKVLAIGLNYRAHALEIGMPIPERPVVFAKFANTICGPEHPVAVPRVSHRVDWEAELCVVIGRRARHVEADAALEYVAGYCNGNDVSVRDWQAHAATWTMGKNFDSHAPMGPWLVTSDEVPNPAALTVRTWVNDELKQDSVTSDLIFSVPQLIEYLSTAMTLEPGDIIFTGTPSGVGQSRTPSEWLKPGDSVRVEVAGLGVLENPVVAEE